MKITLNIDTDVKDELVKARSIIDMYLGSVATVPEPEPEPLVPERAPVVPPPVVPEPYERKSRRSTLRGGTIRMPKTLCPLNVRAHLWGMAPTEIYVMSVVNNVSTAETPVTFDDLSEYVHPMTRNTLSACLSKLVADKRVIRVAPRLYNVPDVVRDMIQGAHEKWPGWEKTLIDGYAELHDRTKGD